MPSVVTWLFAIAAVLLVPPLSVVGLVLWAGRQRRQRAARPTVWTANGLAALAGLVIVAGIPAPGVLAPFVGVVEIGGEALRLFGLVTRLAAIPLIIDMLVAIATTKIRCSLRAASGRWPSLLPREVATFSGDQPDACLALEDEEIEGGRFAGEFGQQAMGLAPVMGLMVEEMQK